MVEIYTIRVIFTNLGIPNIIVATSIFTLCFYRFHNITIPDS